MNIVAWADSAEIAHAKTAAYFERFDWHIVEVEEAQAIGQGQLHPHPHLPGPSLLQAHRIWFPIQREF
jgi:hypothetical protein